MSLLLFFFLSFTRYHIGSYDKNCAFFLGNKFFASKIYGSYFYVLCRAGTVIFNKMFYSIIKCKLEWAEKKKKKMKKIGMAKREREREKDSEGGDGLLLLGLFPREKDKNHKSRS